MKEAADLTGGVIAVLRKDEPGGKDVIGLETEMGLTEVDETPHEKSRADQQNDSGSHFENHYGIAKAQMAKARARAPRSGSVRSRRAV